MSVDLWSLRELRAMSPGPERDADLTKLRPMCKRCEKLAGADR